MYGKHVAVKGLSLELHTGGITALLGHNGAGKTTAIGMLTGLVRPDGGDCRVLGKSMLTQAGAARRHLGYCPQHNVLFGGLTVQEHLHIFAAIKVPAGLTPAKQSVIPAISAFHQEIWNHQTSTSKAHV